MTTWDSAEHFTPVSACSLDGDTVERCWWDFSAPGMLATDFTQHGTGLGGISIAEGALRFDLTSQGDIGSYSGDPTGGTYVEIAGDQAAEDFDVQCTVGDFTLLSSGSVIWLGVRVTGGASTFYGAIMYEPWGRRVIVGFAGLKAQALNIGSVSNMQLRIIYDQSASQFHFYYRTDANDAWTLLYTHTTGTTPVRVFLGGATTSATPNDEFVEFSELKFTVGHPLDAVVQVHDSGLAYLDAGAGDAWDNSTLATDAPGSTIDVRYADSATTSFGAYSDWIPLSDGGGDFHDEADTDLRYRAMQLRITDYAISLTEVGMSTYDVDTTAPANPTATKFVAFETDKIALDWTEPADVDFDYCHLRRDTAANGQEYLTRDGTWSLIDHPHFPIDYPVLALPFREGVQITASALHVPASGWVDDTGPAEPTYYVKAYDEAGNASAWTPFSAGTAVTGEPPAAPEISLSDNEDGATATATVSGADPDTTNAILTRPRGSGAWTESGSIEGNGTVTLTLDPGAYWAAVRSTRGTRTTLGAVAGFWITDGDDGFQEIRTALRARLAEDSVLAALLGAADPVGPDSPGAQAELPALSYALGVEPVAALDAPGAAELTLTLRAAAEGMATLDRIAGAAHRLLDGTALATPHWSVRPLRPLGTEDSAADRRGADGAPVLVREMRFAGRALRSGA